MVHGEDRALRGRQGLGSLVRRRRSRFGPPPLSPAPSPFSSPWPILAPAFSGCSHMGKPPGLRIGERRRRGGPSAPPRPRPCPARRSSVCAVRAMLPTMVTTAVTVPSVHIQMGQYLHRAWRARAMAMADGTYSSGSWYLLPWYGMATAVTVAYRFLLMSEGFQRQ